MLFLIKSCVQEEKSQGASTSPGRGGDAPFFYAEDRLKPVLFKCPEAEGVYFTVYNPVPIRPQTTVPRTYAASSMLLSEAVETEPVR